MASNFPTPFTEYSVMLQDMSNHVSRSQLLHRLSTQSSGTSGSSKRAPARVTKQNSAGNSPHNVQRRRTTANTARTHPRLSQGSPYQTQEQYFRGCHSARQALERPMSWHPGSDMISTSAMQSSTSEPALGNAIAGFQNLAVSGQPAPSVQHSIENAFAMGYGFPNSTPLMIPDQPPVESEDYEPAPESIYRPESSYDSDPMYNPYSYNTLQQLQHPFVPQPSTQNTYPTTNYQLPLWPESHSSFAHDFHEPPTSTDLFNWSSNVEQTLNVKAAPQISKRTTKVLSGIGLYDDKEADFVTDAGGDPNRDSMGKGLKLEETWQPPKDEEENDDDDDEESCSTDDDEDIEEDPPIVATAPAHVPTDFYPPYGDLSQQSFFFANDDDPYNGADAPYSNYLAYGQAQPKPEGPVASNFLWC